MPRWPKLPTRHELRRCQSGQSLIQGSRGVRAAAFGRKGKFVEGELDVYVISTKGVMLASGGPSSALVGRDVTDLKDAAGKPFFREMLDKAKTSGSGAVEYYSLNPIDNKMGRKLAYFQTVDDRMIGGWVLHRSGHPAQAQAMLTRRCRRWRTIRPRPSMKSTSCTVPFRRTICTSLSST